MFELFTPLLIEGPDESLFSDPDAPPVDREAERRKIWESGQNQTGVPGEAQQYIELRKALDAQSLKEGKLATELADLPSVAEQMGLTSLSQVARQSVGNRGASSLSNIAAMRGSVNPYVTATSSAGLGRLGEDVGNLDHLAGVGLGRARRELAVQDLENQSRGAKDKDYASRNAMYSAQMDFEKEMSDRNRSAAMAGGGSAIAGAGQLLSDYFKGDSSNGQSDDIIRDDPYLSDERAKTNVRNERTPFSLMARISSQFPMPGALNQYAYNSSPQGVPGLGPSAMAAIQRATGTQPIGSGVASKENIKPFDGEYSGVSTPVSRSQEQSQSLSPPNDRFPEYTGQFRQENRLDGALKRIPPDLHAALKKGVNPRHILREMANRERINDNGMLAEELDSRADKIPIDKSEYSERDRAREVTLMYRRQLAAAGLQPVLNTDGSVRTFTNLDETGLSFRDRDFAENASRVQSLPAFQQQQGDRQYSRPNGKGGPNNQTVPLRTPERAAQPAQPAQSQAPMSPLRSLGDGIRGYNQQFNPRLVEAAQPISYNYKPEWQKMLGPGSEGQKVGVNATEIAKAPGGEQLVTKVDSPMGQVETLKPDKVIGASLGFSAMNAKKNMELTDRIAQLESMIFGGRARS
jgi:hypothetical protein